MATIKKRLSLMVCATLMTSFFPMLARSEHHAEKNYGPGLGYYTAKTVLHVVGLAATFFGGTSSDNKWTTFESFAVICHGAGFVLPFFCRKIQLLYGGERDRRFWTGVGMNLPSIIVHFYGLYASCDAGIAWKDADFVIGDDKQARLNSLWNAGFGAVLHLIGGFLNEYGSYMMEEQHGMKVAVKMRGFDHGSDQETSLKQEIAKTCQKQR